MVPEDEEMKTDDEPVLVRGQSVMNPVKLSDFNNIDGKIPDWISKMVHKDNLAFNADRQMFNPVFFGFIQVLLKYLTANVLDMEDDATEEERQTIFKPI